MPNGGKPHTSNFSKCLRPNFWLAVCAQAVLFVGLQPQPPLEAPDGEPDSYVALLSGLGVGDENADPMPLSLVVDYLTGLLGSGEEQQRVSQVGALRMKQKTNTLIRRVCWFSIL